MSEALAALTKTAVALPYEEQRELLHTLTISVNTFEAAKKSRPSREEIEASVRSFMGRSHSWQGEDALEYQRKMREERDIG